MSASAATVLARPPSVLVVEDDHAVRETLHELLLDEGYEVLLAANGREALDLLRAATLPPDLVLLDLMMPVMDGRQLGAELRRDPALAAIPVVVMSADGGLEEKVAGMGAAAVLPKPVALDRLLDTLARLR